MQPEDYGALYLQWATAIHGVDPTLKLGGPVFQGENEDIQVWPDAQGKISWFGRFLDYLKLHGRVKDLAFMSFEHYPYEPCKITWTDLYAEPRLVSHILDVWRADGLPPEVPMLITEVNLAWQTGESFVDILGGLWVADYVGAFLTAGGKATYYFHYPPTPLQRGCDDSWGTFGMFNADPNYHIKQYTSQYFASRLLTQEWVEPGDGLHQVFQASSDVKDAAGNLLVTAYALRRSDGQWALLLINKDRETSHAVRVVFHDSASSVDRFWAGPVTKITFGAAQYRWHPRGSESYAEPDGPVVTSEVEGGVETRYDLPAASIVVLRGKVR